MVKPPNGWVQNTNNWPWSAAGAFSPAASRFPKYMDMFGENARGVHAVKLLTGSGGWTLEGLNRAAFDSAQPGFEALIPGLVQAFDAIAPSDARRARLEGPITALRGWDFRWSAELDPEYARSLLGRGNLEAFDQPRMG